MYCFNCGAKLVDGAKCCSKCRMKIYYPVGKFTENPAEATNSKLSVEEHLRLGYLDGEAELEEIRHQHIEEVFHDVFKGKKLFGDKVYIIGKNSISKEMRENLEEYFLEDSSEDSVEEKPLLAFNYKKEMEEGFVITNHRLVWNYSYPSKGLQEVEIDNIKDVLIGKRGLSTVMQVVDNDNALSSDIYLTGIDNLSAFISKFSKFVDEVYMLFYGQDEDKDYYVAGENISENNRGDDRKIKDMLIKACHTVNIDLIYCEMGNPVVCSTSKKYLNAKNNFGIPNEDDIFFIYDATVFGSCKKGFAICNSGIYYCGRMRGYWTWNEFKKLNITCGFSGLKMGEEVFTAAGNDGKKTLAILGTIQEYLR